MFRQVVTWGVSLWGVKGLKYGLKSFGQGFQGIYAFGEAGGETARGKGEGGNGFGYLCLFDLLVCKVALELFFGFWWRWFQLLLCIEWLKGDGFQAVGRN